MESHYKTVKREEKKNRTSFLKVMNINVAKLAVLIYKKITIYFKMYSLTGLSDRQFFRVFL